MLRRSKRQWDRTRRTTVAARHIAFVEHLKRGARIARARVRIAQPIAPALLSLRRASIITPSWRSTFMMSSNVHTSVFMPAGERRVPGTSVRHTERVIEQRRAHHTYERIETRTHDRMRSILLRQVAASVTQRASTARPPATRREQSTDFPRIATTMVRSATSPQTTEPPPNAPIQSRSAIDAVTAPPRMGPPAVTPVPAQELTRVTEHVLRTLDRRVLSYRERTGQV